MKEIFVIYNKNTGRIDGGVGKIDRDWDAAHADGSTMLERIPYILAKDPDREVVYLPLQKLPDSETHKIENDEIVPLTSTELIADNLGRDQKTLIEQEVRKLAIQSLIDQGLLPVNFKE